MRERYRHLFPEDCQSAVEVHSFERPEASELLVI